MITISAQRDEVQRREAGAYARKVRGQHPSRRSLTGRPGKSSLLSSSIVVVVITTHTRIHLDGLKNTIHDSRYAP
jgi:hypothetical protein